jgi:subtilisin family serine protease
MLLILCAIMAGSAAAQERFKIRIPQRESASHGVPGMIVVKLTRGAFARGATIGIFGPAAERYGIYDMASWIDPRLLTFTTPLPKGSAEGEPMETPAHSLGRIMRISYSSLDAPEDVAMALAHLPGVEYAEVAPKHELLFTPNDPLLAQQYHIDQIRARQAWDLQRGDSTMLIAITDSGIEKDHNDLKDAMWMNPGENGKDDHGRDKASNGVDDDGNGFVDDAWGWDFGGATGAEEDNDPSGVGEEHGTHVAGIAAASGNNALGVVGVAFGAKLMAVKITDDKAFPGFFREIDGVFYAARMKAKVINCSWGGTTSSRAEQEAFHVIVHDLGIIVVAAAGNRGLDEKYYPASYDGVISVGALRSDDSRWDSSDFNYRLDISAPGDAIYSTVLGNSYGYLSGTSMASPMVAGAAALVKMHYPALKPDQVAEQLRATADNLSASIDPAHLDKMGTGRLNVRRALEEDPMSTTSARLVHYTVIDPNGDGAADPGETIRIKADIKNILGDASSVTAELTIVSGPSIPVTSPTMSFGAMISGQVATTADSAFIFTVPDATPANTVLLLRIAVATRDRVANEYFTLRVAPTFLTTDLNDIVSTFNSVGNIAFNGTTRNEGDGFNYRGSENLMFHGGLLIGRDADHLSDVVRTGGLFSDPADGFRASQLYRLQTLPDSSEQIGTARFSDLHRGSDGVGVEVTMETREYRDSASSNIVLAIYHIRNTNATAIDGLRCGLFLDWDVSTSGFDDQTGFDAAHKLAYARDATGSARIYMGAALLTQQDASYYAVDNSTDAFQPATAPQQKWTMLASGVHENPAIDDMAMVIGAGPITIEPGKSVDVAFALIGAADFAALRASATHAGTLFTPSSVPAPAPPSSTLAVALSPNPFGGSGSIAFTMPATGHATVEIYDIRGAKLATIFDGTLAAGRQSIPFTADGLPDGVYLYSIRAGDAIEQVKGVLMRR